MSDEIDESENGKEINYTTKELGDKVVEVLTTELPDAIKKDSENSIYNEDDIRNSNLSYDKAVAMYSYGNLTNEMMDVDIYYSLLNKPYRGRNQLVDELNLTILDSDIDEILKSIKSIFMVIDQRSRWLYDNIAIILSKSYMLNRYNRTGVFYDNTSYHFSPGYVGNALIGHNNYLMNRRLMIKNLLINVLMYSPKFNGESIASNSNVDAILRRYILDDGSDIQNGLQYNNVMDMTVVEMLVPIAYTYAVVNYHYFDEINGIFGSDSIYKSSVNMVNLFIDAIHSKFKRLIYNGYNQQYTVDASMMAINTTRHNVLNQYIVNHVDDIVKYDDIDEYDDENDTIPQAYVYDPEDREFDLKHSAFYDRFIRNLGGWGASNMLNALRYRSNKPDSDLVYIDMEGVIRTMTKLSENSQDLNSGYIEVMSSHTSSGSLNSKDDSDRKYRKFERYDIPMSHHPVVISKLGIAVFRSEDDIIKYTGCHDLKDRTELVKAMNRLIYKVNISKTAVDGVIAKVWSMIKNYWWIGLAPILEKALAKIFEWLGGLLNGNGGDKPNNLNLFKQNGGIEMETLTMQNNGVSNFIGGMIDWVKSTAGKVIEFAKKYGGIVWNFGKNIVVKSWDFVKSTASKVWNWITGLFS